MPGNRCLRGAEAIRHGRAVLSLLSVLLVGAQASAASITYRAYLRSSATFTFENGITIDVPAIGTMRFVLSDGLGEPDLADLVRFDLWFVAGQATELLGILQGNLRVQNVPGSTHVGTITSDGKIKIAGPVEAQSQLLLNCYGPSEACAAYGITSRIFIASAIEIKLPDLATRPGFFSAMEPLVVSASGFSVRSQLRGYFLAPEPGIALLAIFAAGFLVWCQRRL